MLWGSAEQAGGLWTYSYILAWWAGENNSEPWVGGVGGMGSCITFSLPFPLPPGHACLQDSMV